MLKLRTTIDKIKSSIWLFFSGFIMYWDDFIHFARYSNVGPKGSLKDQKLSSIITNYHIVEKGLAMPKRRLGFGEKVIRELVSKCDNWLDLYGCKEPQVCHAISVISEYNELHKKSNYQLLDSLQLQIDHLLSRVNVQPTEQLHFTKKDFFVNANGDFECFSNSRHSVRWFCGEADKSKVLSAIKLAQNTPSSCNKQSTRVHLVLNKSKTQRILDLQQGNRGFGHLIENVIVVTSDLNFCSRYQERHSPYIDSGMYAMNLLYALHFNEIGAIPLVWLSNNKREKELSSIISIPQNEVPILIIGIGEVADDFYQVSSPRRHYEDITFIHE